LFLRGLACRRLRAFPFAADGGARQAFGPAFFPMRLVWRGAQIGKEHRAGASATGDGCHGWCGKYSRPVGRRLCRATKHGLDTLGWPLRLTFVAARIAGRADAQLALTNTVPRGGAGPAGRADRRLPDTADHKAPANDRGSFFAKFVCRPYHMGPASMRARPSLSSIW